MGKWLGERARDWQTGAYRPQAVRQVLIPKKQAGQTRPLGIPCVRDRVAQTAAAWVLTPIFKADLQPEQYAYRAGRSALDAVRRVHRLLNTGHQEVVDADLSNYFGEIPHAELLRSLARRIRDGRLLGWLKAWLEMAVEEDTGPGGPRRTNRARRERKGTPQGAPISPLLSNLSRRRFLLGWKTLGYARRFGAEIANSADDFVICGRAPAEALWAAVERMMERLRLPLNARKTRCVRVPEEPVEFLGYRVGRTYRRDTGREYLGTRPSAESVRRVGRKVSELTQARDGWLDEGEMVERWNRVLLGWANYFRLGQVSPAYRAIDAPTTQRLRQGLCRKHQVRTGQYVRYPDERLWQDLGLTRLRERPASFAWAKAGSRPRAQCGKTARWVRGAGRGNVVKVETEAPTLGRKPSATATPATLDKRASPRLYGCRYATIYATLLKERCCCDSCSTVVGTLVRQVGLYLHRGISYRVGSNALCNIEALDSLAIDAAFDQNARQSEFASSHGSGVMLQADIGSNPQLCSREACVAFHSPMHSRIGSHELRYLAQGKAILNHV